MEETIVPITKETLMLAVLVAAVIQVFKGLPFMTEKLTKYLPLAGLALGVIGAFWLTPDNPVLSGITAGLLASGGYKALTLPASNGGGQ